MTASGPASAGPERVLTLPDGRQVALAETGDPAGVPVVFFHGTPGSRRTVPPDPDLAARLGVRLLTFDRPGYGGSTRQAGRVVHATSADVGEIAEQLGLTTFGLAAWSGGAAFALAATEVFGARVRGVAIVSPFGPFDEPEAAGNLPPDRARRIRLLSSRHVGTRTAAVTARLSLRRVSADRRRDPGRWVDELVAGGTGRDRVLLARADVRDRLAGDAVEALRQGAVGWADDLAALTTPWSIVYRDVRRPVTIWHGTADTDVKPAAAEALAGALPDCTLHLVDGAGHHLLHQIWPDVLTAACG